MFKLKRKTIVYFIILSPFIFGAFYFKLLELNDKKISFHYSKLTNSKVEKKEDVFDEKLSKNEENNSIIDTVTNVVENKFEKILDKTFILEYPNFNIEYNCDNGNYNYVHYKVNKNNYKDIDYSISFNNKVVENCEYDKTIIEDFKNLNLDTPKNQPKYSMHLGINKKLIPSDSIKDTFSRANIIPIQENLNSVGSSLVYLDRIAECHSNKQIEIISGTIFEDIEEDDYFFEKYKMKTPDYLFHILIIDQIPYSYIFPNDPTPLTYKLDSYSESIYNIEKRAGFTLDFLPKEYSKQKNLLNLTLKGCS